MLDQSLYQTDDLTGALLGTGLSNLFASMLPNSYSGPTEGTGYQIAQDTGVGETPMGGTELGDPYANYPYEYSPEGNIDLSATLAPLIAALDFDSPPSTGGTSITNESYTPIPDISDPVKSDSPSGTDISIPGFPGLPMGPALGMPGKRRAGFYSAGTGPAGVAARLTSGGLNNFRNLPYHIAADTPGGAKVLSNSVYKKRTG